MHSLPRYASESGRILFVDVDRSSKPAHEQCTEKQVSVDLTGGAGFRGESDAFRHSFGGRYAGDADGEKGACRDPPPHDPRTAVGTEGGHPAPLLRRSAPGGNCENTGLSSCYGKKPPAVCEKIPAHRDPIGRGKIRCRAPCHIPHSCVSGDSGTAGFDRHHVRGCGILGVHECCRLLWRCLLRRYGTAPWHNRHGRSSHSRPRIRDPCPCRTDCGCRDGIVSGDRFWRRQNVCKRRRGTGRGHVGIGNLHNRVGV